MKFHTRNSIEVHRVDTRLCVGNEVAKSRVIPGEPRHLCPGRKPFLPTGHTTTDGAGREARTVSGMRGWRAVQHKASIDTAVGIFCTGLLVWFVMMLTSGGFE